MGLPAKSASELVDNFQRAQSVRLSASLAAWLAMTSSRRKPRACRSWIAPPRAGNDCVVQALGGRVLQVQVPVCTGLVSII